MPLVVILYKVGHMHDKPNFFRLEQYNHLLANGQGTAVIDTINAASCVAAVLCAGLLPCYKKCLIFSPRQE